MSPERAVHELRSTVMEMLVLVELSDHPRAESVARRAIQTLNKTEQAASITMVKQWELERFKESGWSQSPNQGI